MCQLSSRVNELLRNVAATAATVLWSHGQAKTTAITVAIAVPIAIATTIAKTTGTVVEVAMSIAIATTIATTIAITMETIVEIAMSIAIATDIEDAIAIDSDIASKCTLTYVGDTFESGPATIPPCQCRAVDQPPSTAPSP